MRTHILHPRCLLACLFLLTTHVLAVAEPDARPEPEPEPEVAAGGGVAATSIVASQMASITNAGSLFTVGGTTSAVWTDVTITFATTALGTWALGATPAAGSIGLGTIQGTVGKVKTKRAQPTPAPEDAA